MTPSDLLPLFGRVLIVAGLLMALFGLLLAFGGRIPLLGKLPGDLVFEWGKFRVYLPIATSLLLSVVVTLILMLVSYLRR